MAGIIFLIACGKITLVIDLLKESPKLLAASICPLSIACIPPLKISAKNDKFGYVYYNPDKKTANFRFYMEIADELLKCLCNNPYSRKKYNLSTAYYDKHKK